MSIEFSCPGCKRVYSVAERLADTRVKCKGCGTWMRVPTPPAQGPGQPTPPSQPSSSQVLIQVQPVQARTIPADQTPPEPAAPAPAGAGLAARLLAAFEQRQFLTVAVAAGTLLLMAGLLAIGVVAFWPVRQASQTQPAGEAAASAKAGPSALRPGQARPLPPRDLSPWTPDLTEKTLPALPAQCEGILMPSSPASPFLLLLRQTHDRTAPAYPARQELVLYDLRSRRELSCLETVNRRSLAGCLSPDGSWQAEVVAESPLRLVVRSTHEDRESAALTVDRPIWYDFAGPDRLVVLDANRSTLTVWNHLTGRFERQITLPRPAYVFAQGAVSPDGRRAVVSGRPYRTSDGRLAVVIHVLDLQAGTALNDLWLAGGEGYPVVEGFAFTIDGSRLAALFRMVGGAAGGYRIVAWDAATGSALHNHALEPRLIGPRLSCRPVIQWTADGRAWLVDGRAFVDAASGAAAAAEPARPAAWSRILGPELALVADQVGLPLRYELRVVRQPSPASATPRASR